MNNKKIFSVHLFWQTIKQTKVLGLIFTAILAFYSGMGIISNVDSLIQYNEQMTVTGVDESVVLLVVVFLFAPIISIVIWNFQNKRNSSDFYGALPYKKLCIYTSKTAASVAWVVFMILLSYVIRMVLYLIYSKYFIVSYGVLTHMYVAILISAIYVISAVSVAVSFTGNAISNMCVTGMVIYLPRFILNLLNLMAYEKASNYMTMEYGAGLLDNAKNMVVGVTLGNVMGASLRFRTIFLSVANNVYTLVLALIFFVLAGILYRHRPSEVAGKSSYGKVLPMVIRVLIVFIISVIGTCAIIGEDETYYIVEIIAITFFIAAISVIIFEFLTNRRGRIIRNCIPAIVIGYVCAFAFCMASNAYGEKEVSYIPDSGDISYVTITAAYSYDDEYYSNMTSNIKLDNDEIIELAANAFERTKRNCDGRSNDYCYRDDSAGVVLLVRFQEGMIGRYRYVKFTKDEYAKLGDCLANDQRYVDAYLSIPYSNKCKITNEIYMTDSDKNLVYDSLVAESKEIKFSKWVENQNDYCAQKTISIQFAKGGKSYYADVNITERTPKTFKLLVEKINADTSNNYKSEMKAMSDYFKKASNNQSTKLSDGDSYTDISMTVVTTEAQRDIYIESYIDSGINSSAVNTNMRDVYGLIAEKLAKGNINETIDPNKAFVEISYFYSAYGTYEKETQCKVMLQLDGYETLADYGLSKDNKN